MILLDQNNQLYNNDLRAMLMAFYPGEKIVEDEMRADSFTVTLRIRYGEADTILTVCKQGNACDKPDDLAEPEDLPAYRGKLLLSSCGYRAKILADYRDKQSFRNILKIASYRLLGQLADRRLPWGDLTGVRPTKIAMRAMTGQGMTHAETVRYYRKIYDVSEQKAELATTVAERERTLIAGVDGTRDYCLYVGIPFCPSRCLYCSFTSYPIAACQELAPIYIDRLCEELDFLAEAYRDKHPVSVYIGGGTPTSVSHELLERLLLHIKSAFRLDAPEEAGRLLEFTVEAGRPDSITSEKLAVMKQCGVTRISINPQTMNDATLATIGRAHNSDQVRKAFSMARQAGFDNINMDLIAGLPGEDLSHMRHTLDEVKTLAPESLTVHSLAIKRAANLRQQMDSYGESINRDMDGMHALAQETAVQMGMQPYYLYRQKNIGGNLENVGYAKPGRECLYNILIMEEITDIAAAGAGASSKLIRRDEKRVDRVENCKSVTDYIDRTEEMLDRKRKEIYNEREQA